MPAPSTFHEVSLVPELPLGLNYLPSLSICLPTDASFGVYFPKQKDFEIFSFARKASTLGLPETWP